ncbi:hypothetical protein GCM10009721_00550 [Terrabacter tumescens]|uniref:Uncharacterized protein n=2 Tax=Terrabacter tumescens TaxID=60443 RepID=A0ABQ2HFP8_9MICO|nr:hypothetical protein GCM10009721_00550 [Terrabacter tumescens]
MPMTRKSAAVTVGAVALASLGIYGAVQDDDHDFAGVCVDEATQTRIADDRCDDHHSAGFHGGHGWYFVPRGVAAPGIGARVAGGSYTAPPSSKSWGSGFKADGGVVTRGGFSGHGFSVGG